MTVVPFARAHVAEAAALERLCFSAPWSAQALAEELDNPQAVFRAAVDENGRLLGYAGMFHVVDEGFFANVAVLPDCRRQGVASALMDALRAYGETHGLCRLTLEVRVSNAAAIALYERHGYVRDGIRRGFYCEPREDAAIYSLYFAKPKE